MKKLFGVAQLEEARSCVPPIKKHHELKYFGRFWYQEIRDFLIPGYRVDLILVLCLPRMTVLVSIEADRPGTWFPGLLGPYRENRN
jgi:hypothetical protein